MIATRNASCYTGKTARGDVMTLPNVANVQCEALFASTLQASDAVSADVATAEIRRTIKRLGLDGCASRMAEEFGDHPEEARDRMRWARRLAGQLAPTVVGPAAGRTPSAA